MAHRFDGPEEAWEVYLRNYYAVATADGTVDAYPCSAADLLQPDLLEPIIRIQAEQLGQPVNRIVGMMFAKRYSVLIMGILSAISLFDRMPDTAPDKVRLVITHYAQMKYRLAETPVHCEASASGEERELRAGQAQFRLLRDHVGPVYAAVSARTGAHPGAMWSLLSANIQNMYLKISSGEPHPIPAERAAIAERDLERLLDRTLRGVPGFERNPLAVRLRAFRHPQYEGASFWLRSACCLAHHLTEDGEEHGYCATCPKASPEQRLCSLKREYG